MPRPPTNPRIVPRKSSERIARVGLGTAWWSDLYHQALTMSWGPFVAAGTLVYVAANALFAGLYMLQPGSIQNARPGSFADAFFFSVQCISTIGFGGMLPATFYANVLTTAEAVVGLAVVALATGSVFARISRPTARVMFGKCTVIGPYNGVPTLSVRLGNQRTSQIVEAAVSVSLLRSEYTTEGVGFRRFYDLTLARSHTPVFGLTFSVMHPIDAASPLAGTTPEQLEEMEAELLVTVTGLEETTSQTVHARCSYTADEILWDRRFADVFKRDGNGQRYIDYSRFHDTEPAANTPSGGGA